MQLTQSVKFSGLIIDHSLTFDTHALNKTASVKIKVGLLPSKKKKLFSSMIALQNWWKMVFTSC